MSIEKVRAYFEHFGIADRIREFDVSSATVELAAVAALYFFENNSGTRET